MTQEHRSVWSHGFFGWTDEILTLIACQISRTVSEMLICHLCWLLRTILIYLGRSFWSWDLMLVYLVKLLLWKDVRTDVTRRTIKVKDTGHPLTNRPFKKEAVRRVFLICIFKKTGFGPTRFVARFNQVHCIGIPMLVLMNVAIVVSTTQFPLFLIPEDNNCYLFKRFAGISWWNDLETPSSNLIFVRRLESQQWSYAPALKPLSLKRRRKSGCYERTKNLDFI